MCIFNIRRNFIFNKKKESEEILIEEKDRKPQHNSERKLVEHENVIRTKGNITK